MINIYKVTNLVNSKGYVGKDSTGHRIADHFRCALSGCAECGGTSLLHKAIRKYGEENFSVEILEQEVPEAEWRNVEDSHIDQENTLRPAGYNSTLNGDPFQLYENRWVKEEGSDGYEKIIDYLPPQCLNEDVNTIAPDAGATRNADRVKALPNWAQSGNNVKHILIRAFPKLENNNRQRLLAGRWARIIQLYYRMGLSYRIVAEEMNINYSDIKSLIWRIKRASEGVTARGHKLGIRPRGRPKKILP